MNDDFSPPTSATRPSRLERPPTPAATASTADDTRLAGLAKALGHPARVRILRHLLAADACMCGAIHDVVPLAQSTVSQHLKVLKQAGLIVGEVDGPRVCYSPARAALAELAALLHGLDPDAPRARKEPADA
ncbi:MAG: metalloregulator ArsR/SmtB family transcription factor [bacterium]|nr:metalloregulator ArsR/SmtB family transcription factor [bacterium]